MLYIEESPDRTLALLYQLIGCQSVTETEEPLLSSREADAEDARLTVLDAWLSTRIENWPLSGRSDLQQGCVGQEWGTKK